MTKADDNNRIKKRPQLNPKSRYALQDRLSKQWLANTMPLVSTKVESERKLFSGSYLNETWFEWHYSQDAIEVDPGTPAQKPAPRPKVAQRPAPPKPASFTPAPATGKMWAPGMPVPKGAAANNKKFIPKFKSKP